MDALLTLSRIALDSAAQGIVVYDADNRVVLFNRAWCGRPAAWRPKGFHFSRPCAASDVFRIIERLNRATRVA